MAYNMRCCPVNITLTALLLGFTAIHAVAPSSTRIILDHADTLRSRGDERELIGNVIAHRGDQTLRANRGLYNAADKALTLMGDVALADAEQSLKAAYIYYKEDTGDYEAIGSVDYLRPDSVRIRCSSAQYSENQKRLDLYRNVFLENLKDGTTITGDFGNWNENTQTAIIDGKPIYRRPQRKADPPDTLTIWSGRIKYDQPLNTAEFNRDVNLLYGKMEAVADTLFHEPDSNRATLTGKPVFWRGVDQLSGHYIRLTFSGDSLKTVKIIGDALILNEAHTGSERLNRLSGREALITIIDDSTRSVQAEGDTEAEYHVWDEKDVFQGVNLSASDYIELMFQGKKAQRINLTGTVKGSFYPPRFAPPVEPRKPFDDKRRRGF